MTGYRKYILMFIIESLIFIGVMCVIDWVSDEMHVWYTYLLQGVLFGVFMTLYTLWSDRKKDASGKEEDKR